MWQQILAFGDHQGWIWMGADIEKGQTMMQYIEQWSEDLRKLFHTMLNPCLIISGNVCCLISTLIICSLMFLNQCHSLRIMLLVKANLASSAAISLSLFGNKLWSAYFIYLLKSKNCRKQIRFRIQFPIIIQVPKSYFEIRVFGANLTEP